MNTKILDSCGHNLSPAETISYTAYYTVYSVQLTKLYT